jgi:chitinase
MLTSCRNDCAIIDVGLPRRCDAVPLSGTMTYSTPSHWIFDLTLIAALAASLAACGSSDGEPRGTSGSSTGATSSLGGLGQGGSGNPGGGINSGGGVNPGGGANSGGVVNAGGGVNSGGGVNPGGGSNPGSCGPAVPVGNRCGPGATKGAGTDNLIDDFEAQNDADSCHLLHAGDSRAGGWSWGKDTASPNGAVTVKFEAPGNGAKAGSAKALHATGTGLNGYGGYVAVPFAPCYDASAYKGISFWLKGNVGSAPYVKVSIATPKTIPMAEGGDDSCMAAQQCYNHFTVQYFRVSDVWTRYAFTWEQLAQGWDNSTGTIPRDYEAQTQITGLNFAPVWPDENPATPIMNKSFDFFIDDVSFDIAGPFADAGFKSLITEQQFNSAFPSANATFGNPYQQLATALDDPRFSRIFREGSLDDRKREIAAMMANMKQETGSLVYSEEIDGASKDYCQDADTYYPCSGGQGYHGRGPMQLSWNYNYGQAGEFFASDFGWTKSTLLGNPSEVISSPAKAWKTSMFFWMAWKSQDKNYLFLGLHYRFLREGFGATIRAINGALECPSSAQAQARRQYYQQFCGTLGVGGCDQKLECPAM